MCTRYRFRAFSFKKYFKKLLPSWHISTKTSLNLVTGKNLDPVYTAPDSLGQDIHFR